MSTMNNWRGCWKCGAIFFDGFRDNKGRCPKDGAGHDPKSFNFQLSYNVPGTDHAMPEWRGCGDCGALFFNGFPNKGWCSVRGETGHRAQSENFVIPHDVPATDIDQPGWAGCGKCGTMFFDGFAEKGKCPRDGEGHTRNSPPYVLAHWVTPTVSARAIQSDEGRFVDVDGRGFSPESDVEINYDLFSGGGPTTHETGSQRIRTNVAGNFDDAMIRVNVTPLSGVQLEAVDVPTRAKADARI